MIVIRNISRQVLNRCRRIHANRSKLSNLNNQCSSIGSEASATNSTTKEVYDLVRAQFNNQYDIDRFNHLVQQIEVLQYTIPRPPVKQLTVADWLILFDCESVTDRLLYIDWLLSLEGTSFNLDQKSVKKKKNRSFRVGLPTFAVDMGWLEQANLITILHVAHELNELHTINERNQLANIQYFNCPVDADWFRVMTKSKSIDLNQSIIDGLAILPDLTHLAATKRNKDRVFVDDAFYHIPRNEMVHILPNNRQPLLLKHALPTDSFIVPASGQMNIHEQMIAKTKQLKTKNGRIPLEQGVRLFTHNNFVLTLPLTFQILMEQTVVQDWTQAIPKYIPHKYSIKPTAQFLSEKKIFKNVSEEIVNLLPSVPKRKHLRPVFLGNGRKFNDNSQPCDNLGDLRLFRNNIVP